MCEKRVGACMHRYWVPFLRYLLFLILEPNSGQREVRPRLVANTLSGTRTQLRTDFQPVGTGAGTVGGMCVCIGTVLSHSSVIGLRNVMQCL